MSEQSDTAGNEEVLERIDKASASKSLRHVKMKGDEMEKEVEEMAFDVFHHMDSIPVGANIRHGYIEIFTAGYHAGQKRLLDKASDGFEEWKDRLTYGGNYQVNRLDLHEQTWSAAKLSAFRDVNFTNEQYLKLGERLKEAEALLVTFNDHVKGGNWVASASGTKIDAYFAKHKGEKGAI